MIYLGIDPGKSGGIAAIDEHNQFALKMPETDRDVLTVLDGAVNGAGDVFAALEKVHSMPGQGVRSTFTFGANFGALRMALTALDIPYELVAPGMWQRFMGCLSGGKKNITKRRAQELFPALEITHATADALLLAEYGRRKRLGRGDGDKDK